MSVKNTKYNQVTLTGSFNLVMENNMSTTSVVNRFSRWCQRALVLFIVLCAMPSLYAQTTWTFTPELRRLDPTQNTDAPYDDPPVAPTVLLGDINVIDRSASIRVGLYIIMETDGSATYVPDAGPSAGQTLELPLHFFTMRGRFYFSGAPADDIGAFVADLPTFLQGIGRGDIYRPLFEEVGIGDDRRPGQAFATSSVDNDADASLPSTSFLFSHAEDFVRVDFPKGVNCTPVNGRCEVLVSQLTIPMTNLPADTSAILTVRVASPADGFQGSTATSADPLSFALSGPARDAGIEGDRFIINQSNEVNYVLCPVATGCPARIAFSPTTASVTEGGMTAVTLELSEAASAAGDVVIATVDADTTATTDLYTISRTTVSFAAGDTSQLVTISATENAVEPIDETSTLVLRITTYPTGVEAGVASAQTVTVLINDNDDPAATVEFVQATFSGTEGSTAVAQVTLTPAAPATTPEREVVIPINTMLLGTTTADDFSLPANITFAASATGAALTQGITISITEETDLDRGEQLALSFGTLPAGVTAGTTSTATVDLLDNDSNTIVLTASVVTLAEDVASSTEVEIVGMLEYPSGALDQAASVVLTLSGTATSGTDYSAAPDPLPTITFPLGAVNGASMTVTLTITPVDDVVVEPNEIIVVGGTVAGLGVNAAEITITDSDMASLALTSSAATAVAEGETISITLTPTLARSVDLVVPIVLTTGTALAGDYSAISAVVTLAAATDASAQSFAVVSLFDDDLSEDQETFTISTGSFTGPIASKVTIDSASDTVTINIAAGDMSIVGITAPDMPSEGRDAVYTLNVEGGTSTEDIVVTLATDGVADSADYTGFVANVTIATGETSQLVTIMFVADNTDDPDETFELNITGVSGGPQSMVSTTAATSTVTILEALIASVGSATLPVAVEPSSVPVTINIDRTPDEGINVTINYSLVADTAVFADYSDGGGGSVVISGSDTSAVVTVQIVDDNTSEGMEAFSLMLTSATTNDTDQQDVMLNPTSTVTALSIAANDPLVVSLTGPDRVREGRVGVYTVGLADNIVSTSNIGILVTLDATNTGESFANADDFTGLPTTPVTITAGQSSSEVSLMFVREPTGREGEETLVLGLDDSSLVDVGGGISVSPTANTVTSTIVEIDLNQRKRITEQALSALGRVIAVDMMDAVAERAQAPKTVSQATVAGQRLAQWTTDGDSVDTSGWGSSLMQLAGVRVVNVGTHADKIVVDPIKVRQLLTQSSFQFSYQGSEGNSSGNGLSIWGRGGGSGFKNREGAVSMDGDTVSGQFGVDVHLGNWMVGAAANYTEGDVAYVDGDATSGEINTDMLSFHPYAHYAPENNKLSLWAMAGYGEGEMIYAEDGSPEVKTDTSMGMISGGLRYDLFSCFGIDWSVKSDAFYSKIEADAREEQLLAADANNQRIRVAVSGAVDRQFSNGSDLVFDVELGAKYNAGGAEEGAGVEIGSSVAYVIPKIGLTLKAKARYLLAHEAKDFEEWAANGLISFSSNQKNRGLHFSLTPSWGNTSSNVNAIWESAGQVQQASADNQMKMNAQLGYGFALSSKTDSMLTPYAAINGLQGEQSTRLGTTLKIAKTTGFSFNVDMYRETQNHTDLQHYVVDSRISRTLAHGTVELFSKMQSGNSATASAGHQTGMEVKLKF